MTDADGNPFSRRALLAGVGGLATVTAIGQPAYAAAAAADPASGAGYVDVQLLNITDLHGYLQPPTPAEGGVITGAAGKKITVGGVGYLATHLKRLRQGHRNTIFYSSGDNFSGWPYYVDSQDNEPTIEALNALGLRFSSLGNHELDKGPSFLLNHIERGRPYPVPGLDNTFVDSTGRLFHGADFRFYSGNMLYKDTGKTIVPPYNVEWVDAGGGRKLPIGFVHLTIVGTESFNCSYHPTLTSINEAKVANKYAAELKRRGVNAIILVMHEGGYAGDDFNSGVNPTGPAFELAATVSPNISAIVAGHWHCRFNCMVPDPAGKPRPVVEAGNHGQVINEINLKLDPRSGEVVRELTVSTNHAVTRDVPVDERLQHIADYWVAQADKRSVLPLARTTADITRTANENGESTMGAFIADFMLWESRQGTKKPAEVALVPTKPLKSLNALRGDLLYKKQNESDRDGVIQFGEAWKTYGYDSPIVTTTLTGERLHQALEQQWQRQSDGTVKFAPVAVSAGVRYGFDLTRPVGSRIDPAKIVINGKPLDLKRGYRVAANSLTWLGMDGYSALMVFTEPIRHRLDHEAFIKYLRGRTVSPPKLGRAYQMTAEK